MLSHSIRRPPHSSINRSSGRYNNDGSVSSGLWRCIWIISFRTSLGHGCRSILDSPKRTASIDIETVQKIGRRRLTECRRTQHPSILPSDKSLICVYSNPYIKSSPQIENIIDQHKRVLFACGVVLITDYLLLVNTFIRLPRCLGIGLCIQWLIHRN